MLIAKLGSSGFVMARIWNFAGKLNGNAGTISDGAPLWFALSKFLERFRTLRLELPSVIRMICREKEEIQYRYLQPTGKQIIRGKVYSAPTLH